MVAGCLALPRWLLRLRNNLRLELRTSQAGTTTRTLSNIPLAFRAAQPTTMAEGKVKQYVFADDGQFPNSCLPLLVYPQVLRPPPIQHSTSASDFASQFEARLKGQGWHGLWRDVVYNYHHYHTTAHEALGCFAGHADVLFGGERGSVIRLTTGDAVLIPAGVAHKCVGQSDDFGVVGGYPPGQDVDMKYGHAGERPAADAAIAGLSLPYSDPFILGPDGAIPRIWHDVTSALKS